MARIPVAADVPQAPTGPLQQSTPKVSSKAFGDTGPVDGLAEAAQTVANFANDQRARESAVDRARNIREFNTFANDELRRLETEDDLSQTSIAAGYAKQLKEDIQKRIDAHTGSPASRDALFNRLEDIRFKFTDQASSSSVAAQKALVNDSLSQDISNIALSAGGTPESVFESLAAVDAAVDDMSPALTLDEERDQRLAGKRLVLSTTLDSMFNQGDLDGAKALMKTKGTKDILGPSNSVKTRARILRIEKERRDIANKGQAKINEAAQILGRDLTPEERLRLAKVAPKAGKQALKDKIIEMESVIKRPLTEQEILNVSGVDQTGRSFGKGLQGQALQTVTDLAPAFGDGLLSEDDNRQFLSAVNALQQPITFANPDTGAIETRVPTIPAFVTQALTKQGIGVQPSPIDGQPTNIIPDETLEPGIETIDDQDLLGGLPTIFELSTQATGIGPGLQRLAGGLPVVGSLFDAGEEIQAAKRLELASNDLVNALRRSPRFAEAERGQLLEEFGVSAKILSNPEAAQAELIGLDDGLKVRLQEAQNIIDAPTTTKQERQVAIRERNAIENFREQLGIPVTVNTPEEAGQLPPGTIFFDPNGVLRTVPQTDLQEIDKVGTL